MSRKYIDVFNNKENTLIFENIIKVLSLSSSFFELIITNEIFEINFPDFYFFLHIDNTLNDICTQMPTIIGFSVVQLQRKLSLWTCERLRKKFNYQGNIVFGGSDITYYKEKYLIEFPFIDYAIYQEGEYALPQLLDFLKVEWVVMWQLIMKMLKTIMPASGLSSKSLQIQPHRQYKHLQPESML